MTRAATIDHAKILVVEDSLAEVVLIKHFFATEKITNDVSFATSLREARQALRHHHYDVCFVDIHLPDGQGFELIAELSAMGCLIVMVSDSDDMLNIMKAQGLGAVAFISKPLTKATLDRLVKEMRAGALVAGASSVKISQLDFQRYLWQFAAPMLAMQYSIPLPPNLDAEFIRKRVETRRELFDGHQGLIHKSFIYCPKDHIYAPFYLWRDLQQAQHFLLDDLYQGVIESFGRHRVRSWLVISAEFGDKSITPTFAQRELDAVPASGSLKAFSTIEKSQQTQFIADHPSLYLRVVALDAERWEVMRFSLWANKTTTPQSQSDCLQTYDVLHVSEG